MDNINELFTVEEPEESLAQIERGEFYTIEEVEEEFAKGFGDDGLSQSKEQFDAEMEQAWQEMLNGGGIPFEDFPNEFEREFDNSLQ